MSVEVHHRDVKASGVRLRVAARGEGPCVLLLHSTLFDHTTWDAIAEFLGEGFHVVAPDLPGFGESEKPRHFPYGVEPFADAVADLYAGLHLGRAAVVGHGLGGAVAISLASKHPELVERLVLVDALCYEAAPSFAYQVATLPLVGSFAFKQLLGRAGFAAHFRRVALGRNAPDRIAHYYSQFNSPAARGSALATLRAAADTRAIVAHTAKISCETLVVWGRDDAVYPPALGRRLSKHIAGAGFELMPTGHAPQEEAPGELAELIARFCRKQRAA